MMECVGKLTECYREPETGKIRMTFETADASVLGETDKIKNMDRLTIVAEEFKNKRSLDANKLLWKCLGQIAAVLRADKWDIYLMMLKRYGKYTYIAVHESAVDAIKAQWRESEVIGEVVVNGKKAVQMLCYYGSSTYDATEFSVLVDGVISEMKEIGLQPPMSEEMKAILEKWDAEHTGKLSSVFTDDMDTCIFTGSKDVERHHIFGGRSNKKHSEEYGFIVPLRYDLHPNGARADKRYAKQIDTYLKKMAQRYYEEHCGSREEFRQIFGKSWL